MKKFAQYAGSVACIALIQTPAVAVELYPGAPGACAVSQVNGKISADAGQTRDAGRKGRKNKSRKGGLFQGAASLSIPLNCSYGFQLDAAVGSLDGKSTGGAAAHAFTRNPDSYLLGAYGEYSAVGNNDIWRAGAEAEYYLNNITLSGLVGYENSNRTSGDVFAAVDAALYATENFRITAGYRRFLDIDAAAFGAEYQFTGSAASVFVSGQVGDKKHRTVLAGLRFYFGGTDKSLIRRHREDDPFNRLNELVRNIKTASSTTIGGGEGD